MQALQNGSQAPEPQAQRQPVDPRSQQVPDRRARSSGKQQLPLQPSTGPQPGPQERPAKPDPDPGLPPNTSSNRRQGRGKRPSKQQQEQHRQQEGRPESSRPHPAADPSATGREEQAAAGSEPASTALHPPRGDPMAVGDASQDSDPPSPGGLSTPSTSSSPLEQLPQTLPPAEHPAADSIFSKPGQQSQAADLPPGLSSSQQAEATAHSPRGLAGRDASLRGRRKRGSKRKPSGRPPGALSAPSSAADLPSGFEEAEQGAPGASGVSPSELPSASAAADAPEGPARLISVARPRKPRKPRKPRDRRPSTPEPSGGEEVQQPLGGGPAGLPDAAAAAAAGPGKEGSTAGDRCESWPLQERRGSQNSPSGLWGSTGQASVWLLVGECSIGCKAYAGLVTSLWGISLHGLSCTGVAVCGCCQYGPCSLAASQHIDL